MAPSNSRNAGEVLHVSESSHFPIAFWGLLVLSVGIRLIGIQRPLLGNFSTKSVIYAMIARNWAQGRSGILYPALDCLKGGERSLHMLEFSVSAQLTGALWKVFGGSLDIWGRATSVVFLTASVALLFLFVRRRHGTTAALGAGFVLALSPISIVYGQNFMLDASLLFFTLGTFYCVDRWLVAGRSAWLLPAWACLALLLLTKVYMLVLLVPLGAMVCRPEWFATGQPAKDPRARQRYAIALLGAGLAILPVVLWSLHAIRAAAPGSPTAGHIYSSLQGNAQSYRPPDPLLYTPDFYRQVLDDVTGVVLTPVGFALLLVGFLNRAWRRYAVWLLAMVILVVALPRKFYEMNYYYMAVLPPLCVTAGLGWQVVRDRLRPGRFAVTGLVLVALVFSLRYAFRPAFVTPEEDRAVVAAGRAVQQLAAEEEPVVTMHGAAIDLLYYCNRPGWAVAPDTLNLDSVLEECRRQGARYLVVAGPRATPGGVNALKTRAALVQGDGFCIYPLTR